MIIVSLQVVEKNKKLRLVLNKVPEVSIEQFTVTELNEWVPVFLAEIKRQDKSEYKANSILQFLLCLQTHCKIHDKRYTFLREPRFEAIRNAVDSVMRKRQREGLGNNPRKAEIITMDMEEYLWQNKVLGNATPKQLVQTLIFLFGIRLMLRSGEHRNLRLDMFKVFKAIFHIFHVHFICCFCRLNFISLLTPNGLLKTIPVDSLIKVRNQKL